MLAALDCDTSFGRLLSVFRGSFTRPSFTTFCAMVVGLVCQVGERTVCGMLTAAGMSTEWHHARAHRFFSQAVWRLDDLGLQVLKLIETRLLDPGAPVRLVIDDTLFRRSGRKVADAFWQHDGAADASSGVGYGNNFVVLGVIVALPFMTRPMCLPLLFRIYRKGGPERTELARELVWIASTFLDKRRVEVVADGAYASAKFADLPECATMVSRLRGNAALHKLAPPRTGKRGRPRVRGTRLPSLKDMALDRRRTWRTETIARYGRTEQVQVLTLVCLWYSVFGQRPVRVVLLRDLGSKKAFDFALVATDTDASPKQLIERYAQRWAIEVCFRDSKQVTGVGQARNRVKLAVERTVPFGLLVQTFVVIWYATNGHNSSIVRERRRLAPWYDQKREPSYQDMLTALRRQLITDRFSATRHQTVAPTEIPIPEWMLAMAA